jgi:acetylornithine deacetylase
MTDVAALVQELVATPSLSGQEAEAAALVARHAERQNLSVTRVGPNVIVTVSGAKPGRRLLLNSHLDTVAPVAGWTTDPFKPQLAGGKIVGLGANDAKGCLASMLCAAVAAAPGIKRGELVLALTVEEETGGKGLEAIIGTLGRIDAAVIGEPTGLHICVAQKGLVVLEMITSGTARHAAHAWRLPGKNAVTEAARAILKLEGWQPGAAHPLLGPVTCEVTKIDGGTRSNVIPDRCVVTLDVRTIPGLRPETVANQVSERTGAEVRVKSGRLEPMETDAKADIVQHARRALPEAPLVGSATLSDAVWTRHVPTIKIGPGETERSHTAGEYVTTVELDAGVRFYSQLITSFLGS